MSVSLKGRFTLTLFLVFLTEMQIYKRTKKNNKMGMRVTVQNELGQGMHAQCKEEMPGMVLGKGSWIGDEWKCYARWAVLRGRG